jgi:hypothetical protein
MRRNKRSQNGKPWQKEWNRNPASSLRKALNSIQRPESTRNFELQTLNLELGEAQQGIAEEEALKKGMEEKSKEFVEKGAEVYAKL